MFVEIAKGLLPRKFRKALKHKLLSPRGYVDLQTQPPWSSPNVWEVVVATYLGKKHPAIFEYGAGASSIHHLRNLLNGRGGSYTAVEHDRSWYGRVCGAVVELAVRLGRSCTTRQTVFGTDALDFHMSISMADSFFCEICLKWRAPERGFREGEGSSEQFENYIKASGEGPYDLLVVDGRARKACVDHVLDNHLLKKGGTLALFDAGRGIEGWLGKPALTGDGDYQPAVRRMQAQGATLLDGIGYFSWPNLDEDFLIGRPNPPIPREACVLTLESGSKPARGKAVPRAHACG